MGIVTVSTVVLRSMRAKSPVPLWHYQHHFPYFNGTVILPPAAIIQQSVGIITTTSIAAGGNVSFAVAPQKGALRT
ncbi:MAG: hypothetical protein IPM85_17380 [Chitinophagaceae bacterium]|nr:hypothetical protein [Chitinophagaceae bacterium]